MARLLDRIDSPADLKRLPVDELPRLCQELRDEIIQTCARNGGHLGSSLGAVEINVALHYVFDSPRDKLVWDVGHQAYAHKLLTGRRERFRTSARRAASPASRSGDESRARRVRRRPRLARRSARRSGCSRRSGLRGEPGKVVAVSATARSPAGSRSRASTRSGYLGRDLLVVLNDNEMSISPNVGAMSEWFSKKFASRTYNRWRRAVKEFLAHVPKGPEAIEVIRHGINATKALVTPGILFEGLGFHYVGPGGRPRREGARRGAARSSRRFDGPVLLHAMTQKGKGYEPAEAGPGDARPRPLVLRRRDRQADQEGVEAAYTDVFADALCDGAGAERAKVVAITAAMLEGTGLTEAKQRFPERIFDVGIAEQHAVTFAAGLASEGSGPSSRSTRRSSSAPTTRSSTTSRSRACRSPSRSTAPASSAPTARRTRACSTWPTSAACRTSS